MRGVSIHFHQNYFPAPHILSPTPSASNRRAPFLLLPLFSAPKTLRTFSLLSLSHGAPFPLPIRSQRPRGRRRRRFRRAPPPRAIAHRGLLSPPLRNRRARQRLSPYTLSPFFLEQILLKVANLSLTRSGTMEPQLRISRFPSI